MYGFVEDKTFAREIQNTGIIYLDSAVSSLTSEQVLDKMIEFYRQYRAIIGRGVYQLS
jgi:selenocysteine lyase/cysteine desulfurase